MKKRLAKFINYPEYRIDVIPPVVSDFLSDQPGTPEHSCRRFLFLSGIAQHKNLWRLYDIAVLGFQKEVDFIFVLSVSLEDFLAHIRTKLIIDHKVIDKHFEFHGKIPSNKISTMYESCDALISLSDLESFSNNYMETWKAGLPMICSDRDFSRQICRDSAVYINPHDSSDVIRGMRLVMENIALRTHLIQSGKKQLAKLPSFRTRYNTIASLLCKMIESRDF